MKTIYAILLTAFLFGCTYKGNKSNFISFKDSTHKFNVYFSKKDSITYSIDSISINNIKGNKQSINLSSQKIEVSKLDLNDIISIDKDFNFDGYKDIEVYRNDLSGYNYWSNHFLYNREREKFIANKSLDSIDNIELIPEKKEICSKERAGMMGNSLVKYKWKNDSLIITDKYEEGYSTDGKLHISITKNNKEVVKDSILNKSIVENMGCKDSIP